MGAQARQHRARRALRTEHAARVAGLHAARMARPEVAAGLAAPPDDETARLIARDLDGQRDRLARAGWVQREAGHDGAGIWDHRRMGGTRIIASAAREPDGQVWAHVSVSHRDSTLPGWYEVRDAQRLLYPGEAGVIVVPPEDEHVDIAEVAHVWTCLTSRPVPDFRRFGEI